LKRVRAHLGKCDQYKLIGQGEGSSDDGDVEMATGFSPAPAVHVGQSRSTTPYRSRSRSPVPVEPRSVSPATSIRTPTPAPGPSRPSAASNFKSKTEIFPHYMLTENFTSGMSSAKWGKVVHKRATKYEKFSSDFCQLAITLHSLPASSEGVEIFSAYSLIHKLRNKLGNEKAKKLVK